MKNRLILQLELEDIFFHQSIDNIEKLDSLNFLSETYIIRNHLKDFFDYLKPYFDFSIWTTYNKEVAEYLTSYLIDLGIQIKYLRTDYYLYESEFGKFEKGKRLKRIRVQGAEINQTICVEKKVPQTDNHNNWILIPIFHGQADEALLILAENLFSLKDISDTTRINL